MAREKRIAIAAINIRIHPNHNADLYLDLFKRAYRLQKSVKVFGDQHLKFSSMKIKDGNLEGTIARFTEIDEGSSWYDTESDTLVDEQDNTPDLGSLRPNFSGFNYVFFPQKHLFVFEVYSDSKSLSPNIVEKFLKGLFNEGDIEDRFGVVDTNIFPKVDQLRKIFTMEVISSLDMEIVRPNPDDLEDAESEFFRRLTAQRASKIETKLVAIKGQSIKPDDETKVFAKVAAKNGVVVAKGRDSNGLPIMESTESNPEIKQEYYDPEVTATEVIFKSLSRKMLHSFVNFLNNI